MAESYKSWQLNLYELWRTLPGQKRLGYAIPKAQGRRLIITDVHGCFQSFTSLLLQLKLSKNDQLFILGDMVNRGPYSVLVLDQVIQLIKEGYQIFPLRGNHEQMYLKSSNSGKRIVEIARQQSSLQLLKKGRLRKKYRRFFKMLPYFYETDKAFLVHAGFDFTAPAPFENRKQMLWIRDFKYSAERALNKKIIHGHNPKSLEDIQAAIEKDKPVLPLDNGCVLGSLRDGFGQLVCYDLDSGELFLQPNVDLKPKKKKIK